jgi:hypothetical protein
MSRGVVIRRLVHGAPETDAPALAEGGENTIFSPVQVQKLFFLIEKLRAW